MKKSWPMCNQFNANVELGSIRFSEYSTKFRLHKSTRKSRIWATTSLANHFFHHISPSPLKQKLFEPFCHSNSCSICTSPQQRCLLKPEGRTVALARSRFVPLSARTLSPPFLLTTFSTGLVAASCCGGRARRCGPVLEEGERRRHQPGIEEAARLWLEESMTGDRGRRVRPELEEGGICGVSSVP